MSLYGLEFPRVFPSIPFLRLKSEDLLAGERSAIEQLLGFLDLPWTDGWLEHVGKSVDKWHFHTDEEVEPARVFRHQATLEVAREFGYDFDRLDMDALTGPLHGRVLGCPAHQRPEAYVPPTAAGIEVAAKRVYGVMMSPVGSCRKTLADQSVRELLDAVGARTPAPGGGRRRP